MLPLKDHVAGGGFPGWLTNVPAKARTNQTGFTDAWTPYIEASAKFTAPYQVWILLAFRHGYLDHHYSIQTALS